MANLSSSHGPVVVPMPFLVRGLKQLTGPALLRCARWSPPGRPLSVQAAVGRLAADESYRVNPIRRGTTHSAGGVDDRIRPRVGRCGTTPSRTKTSSDRAAGRESLAANARAAAGSIA